MTKMTQSIIHLEKLTILCKLKFEQLKLKKINEYQWVLVRRFAANDQVCILFQIEAKK